MSTARKGRGRPNKKESGSNSPPVSEVVDLSKINLTESHENDRFHAKTGSLVFKQLLECLNSINITQVKLEFDPDAIRIREECDKNYIYVVFEKSNFELDYHVKQPVVLKADIKNICLFMHNITKGSKYELQAEESDNIRNLNIITRNPNATTEQNKYSVNTLNVTQLEKNEIEPVIANGYEICLKIDASAMHQAIKDYSKLSDNIDITYTNKNLIFESRGGPGTMKHIIDCTHDMSVPESTQIKHGMFRYSNIAMFAKCAVIAKSVTICLENDMPLILEYDIGVGAKISVKIPNVQV
jgi:hypothetical protein